MGEIIQYTCEISSGGSLYLTVVLGQIRNTPIENLIYEALKEIAKNTGDETIMAIPLSNTSRFILMEKFEISPASNPVIIITKTHPDFWTNSEQVRFLELGKVNIENAQRMLNLVIEIFSRRDTKYQDYYELLERELRRNSFIDQPDCSNYLKLLGQKLERVENKLVFGVDELIKGQRFLYSELSEIHKKQLPNVIELVNSKRIEEKEIEQLLKLVQRTVEIFGKQNLNTSSLLLRSMTQVRSIFESSLSMENKLELCLPIIPFLLEYKLELRSNTTSELPVLLVALKEKWAKLSS